MKITGLVEGIGQQLMSAFPGKLMYVENVRAESDGQFFLEIIELSGSDGISARKNRTALLDILYFSKSNDGLDFAQWADTMQGSFCTVTAGGQLLHTRTRRAHAEDMVYHFEIEVTAEYIEYDPAETMLGLGVKVNEK